MRRLPVKDPTTQTDQKLCTKDNCLSCCKKFTAFMFSRVGLFFVMIGYVAIGGWLFQALEAGNEENMRRSMSRELNTTLYKLWDEILRINAYPLPEKKGNFTNFASQELEKFEVTVIQQVQQGFDGRPRPDADTDWNYFGAILYAVTLVSTIGKTIRIDRIEKELFFCSIFKVMVTLQRRQSQAKLQRFFIAHLVFH